MPQQNPGTQVLFEQHLVLSKCCCSVVVFLLRKPAHNGNRNWISFQIDICVPRGYSSGGGVTPHGPVRSSLLFCCSGRGLALQNCRTLATTLQCQWVLPFDLNSHISQCLCTEREMTEIHFAFIEQYFVIPCAVLLNMNAATSILRHQHRR